MVLVRNNFLTQLCINIVHQIPSSEECDSILNSEESHNDHIEPVPQELKNHVAIRMTNLCKTYKSWMKPDVRALNGNFNVKVCNFN